MDGHKEIRFRSNIDIAIQTIIEKEGSASDEEILTALFAQMQRNDAIEIFIFLPIAFCRLLLPNIAFLDEYYEDNRDGNGQRLRKFSETESYQVVLESSSRYFLSKPGSENILKVAGRSGEFHAINDLLNKGNQLEELRMTRMCIVW
jgi:hypothetical protein